MRDVEIYRLRMCTRLCASHSSHMTTENRRVLLTATIRSCAFTPNSTHRVQCLAPVWSALVVDGVTVPYEEVDESTLEFIIRHKSCTPTVRTPHRTITCACSHTRSEFSLSLL